LTFCSADATSAGGGHGRSSVGVALLLFLITETKNLSKIDPEKHDQNPNWAPYMLVSADVRVAC
jgi:hypothetical protein